MHYTALLQILHHFASLQVLSIAGSFRAFEKAMTPIGQGVENPNQQFVSVDVLDGLFITDTCELCLTKRHSIVF
jgi:hypothetical protein